MREDDRVNSAIITSRQSQLIKVLRQTWQTLVGRREFAALVLLFTVSIFLSTQTKTFLSVNNLSNISRAFSWIAIAAFGECIVIVIGGVDLSVGAVMALAGLISALCLQAGVAVPLAIAAGLLTGGLVGWVNGTMVGRVRLPPFVVTLGTMSIVRGMTLSLTGGWPVCNLPPGFRTLGQANLPIGSFSLPVPLLIALSLAVLMSLLLNQTTLGRYIYALSDSEQALLVSGVNVVRIKQWVYILCGLLSAIGGVLMTARLGVAAPTAAIGYEVDIIAAAVIGGASLFGGEGSIAGALLGATLLQILRNGLVLLGFPAHWQNVMLGMMILVAILFDYWRQQRT